jgi:hypothetical protein
MIGTYGQRSRTDARLDTIDATWLFERTTAY